MLSHYIDFMKKSVSIITAIVLMVGVFIIPNKAYAAVKAPGKVSASSIKVTVVDGNSLKFAWGKAKTGGKNLKTTGYQVQYKVEVKQSNGKYKTTTKWKSLKKGKKTNHVYKGVKGNTYRVSIRVRAYNGSKYGGWSATQKKAKKIVKTIPATSTDYPSFKPKFSKQVGSNRAVTVPNYLGTQGCVFDTYTGIDGYNFAMDSVNGGKNGVEVVHFTLENGEIEKMGSVHFNTAGSKPGVNTKEIGHANDGTMFMTESGKKYLFVAISGGAEKNSTDSNGKTIKLGYIDMDEYARAEQQQRAGIIHGVTINTNKVKMSSTLAESKISGITYVGKDSSNREVFVLKDGRTFYAAYLTFANGEPVMTFFDSARIEKPTFKISGKEYDATTQGITYHNEFIYMSYSGEAAKQLCKMKIGRIKYEDLFSETYNDVRVLQLYEQSITAHEGKTLSKHIPEALFFTSLEGEGNIYLSVNRATTASSGSDIDAILISDQKY